MVVVASVEVPVMANVPVAVKLPLTVRPAKWENRKSGGFG